VDDRWVCGGAVMLGVKRIGSWNTDCYPCSGRCASSVCAGRIFEFVHGDPAAPPLLGPNNLPQVVEALLSALRDAPYLAEKVGAAFCWHVSVGFACQVSSEVVSHLVCLPSMWRASPLASTLCAVQVCYAISQLAAGFTERNGTSPMSPYFKDVVSSLLEAVRGADAWLAAAVLACTLQPTRPAQPPACCFFSEEVGPCCVPS
jgi:hypothetical protein